MNRQKLLLLLIIAIISSKNGNCQDVSSAANQFLHSLDSSQKLKALYPFDVDERYSFHYFPIDNRKGIRISELKADQRKAAFNLMSACLTEKTVSRAKDIMSLDGILKQIEHRRPEDHFRDPEGYYFIIFGIPAKGNIW